MLRGKIEGEMALLSEGSSVKENPEDKQASAPCVRGSAKISRRVTLALYTGMDKKTTSCRIDEWRNLSPISGELGA